MPGAVLLVPRDRFGGLDLGLRSRIKTHHLGIANQRPSHQGPLRHHPEPEPRGLIQQEADADHQDVLHRGGPRKLLGSYSRGEPQHRFSTEGHRDARREVAS